MRILNKEVLKDLGISERKLRVAVEEADHLGGEGYLCNQGFYIYSSDTERKAEPVLYFKVYLDEYRRKAVITVELFRVKDDGLVEEEEDDWGEGEEY